MMCSVLKHYHVMVSIPALELHQAILPPSFVPVPKVPHMAGAALFLGPWGAITGKPNLTEFSASGGIMMSQGTDIGSSDPSLQRDTSRAAERIAGGHHSDERLKVAFRFPFSHGAQRADCGRLPRFSSVQPELRGTSRSAAAGGPRDSVQHSPRRHVAGGFRCRAAAHDRRFRDSIRSQPALQSLESQRLSGRHRRGRAPALHASARQWQRDLNHRKRHEPVISEAGASPRTGPRGDVVRGPEHSRRVGARHSAGLLAQLVPYRRRRRPTRRHGPRGSPKGDRQLFRNVGCRRVPLRSR